MPKQLYKIIEFHGGLNSNSDARDIAENELSEATDIMVDEIGRIRLMGGVTNHTAVTPEDDQASGWAGTLVSGYGLFSFSHDRVGAEDKGSAEATTGDNYLVLYDDNDGQLWIYSATADVWNDDAAAANTGVIDIGSTTGAKVNFYIVDGVLRVSDGNFGANNQTQWYGYIDRKFFGDTSSLGHDGDGSDGYSNGIRINKWHADEAALKALTIKDTGAALDYHGNEDSMGIPDASDYVSIYMWNNPYKSVDGLSGVSGGLTTDTQSTYRLRITFQASSPHMTVVAGSSTTAGLANMFSVGDSIYIMNAADAGNNGIKVVTSVSSADPNTMDISGTVAAQSNDYVDIFNLSKMPWFDPTNTGWEFAMSTLYDDSKQESPLSISSNVLEPANILYKSGTTDLYGMTKVAFRADIYTGNGSSTGLPIIHPRVSGFNIYMRRANTATWYQQANIDIAKGIKLATDINFPNYSWATYGGDTESDDFAQSGITEFAYAPQETITYEDSSGISSDTTTAPFDGNGTGFKTAIITNRRAYVGNVAVNDLDGTIKKMPDSILKSQVNQFDSFSITRRLASDINDGDEIVKLEEYADRLLQFKKKKMTLINISQDIEFIEDNFMYKGVTHPAAVCKTDFGIAWVNEQGCYLYDGQKVRNLLEKQGRQIIKESTWASFAVEPMIGYIPKKRQLLVVDDITTNGTGASYLYDMVTQSWVKGAAATINDQNKTNFVIDYNNDLVYAHTNGNVVKWDDASDDSTAVDIKTKDIDFGQPAQTKRIYKFYITHRGSASNIQLSYAINGDQDTYTEAGSELPVTSAVTDWVTTAITPTKFLCYSLRLRLFSDGTTPANFEINDITIVYRIVKRT